MALLTTIQQAARNALAAWLTAELADADDTVVVEPRWFEVDRSHPPKSITIIDAGPRRIEWGDPEVLSQTSSGAANVVATWAIGDVEQRVQLDVWAPSDLELDDLIARLDVSLNAGHRGLGGANVEPVTAGLVLELDDGWSPGTVAFAFDEPFVSQVADDANQAEWRATYRGVASARLVATATSPRIARVALKQRVSETDAAAVNTDVMTLSGASTETYSTEP